jgi:peptide/nickel transport system permease protein
MTIERGRIEITGFEASDVEDRKDLSDWSEDMETEVVSRWRKVLRQLIHDPLALIGGTFVLLMLIIAIFSRPVEMFGMTIQPVSITPYDPVEPLVSDEKYAQPNILGAHKLGTDRLGRDVLSRVMAGSRFSVTIGIIVTALAATFGTVYGGISGYFGGKVDALFMRIVDMVFAFPGLVLAIVIVSMLGRGYWELVMAFALVGWAGYARLIRGEILKVKQNEYVLAAKALGAGNGKVLFKHVIPNAIAPVIVQATLSIGTVVIGVAALSFLGLGPTGNVPEWGTMIDNHRDTIVTASSGWRYWWVTFFPGIMIFIFVMSMNMIGDAVNDALDAQSEQSVDNVGGG